MWYGYVPHGRLPIVYFNPTNAFPYLNGPSMFAGYEVWLEKERVDQSVLPRPVSACLRFLFAKRQRQPPLTGFLFLSPLNHLEDTRWRVSALKWHRKPAENSTYLVIALILPGGQYANSWPWMMDCNFAVLLLLRLFLFPLYISPVDVISHCSR